MAALWLAIRWGACTRFLVLDGLCGRNGRYKGLPLNLCFGGQGAVTPMVAALCVGAALWHE